MKTALDQPTVGQIDTIEARSSRLLIRGWIAAFEETVGAFEVRWGRRVYRDVAFKLGLPHPAIARFYPQLSGGARSGFEIEIPLEGDDDSRLAGHIVYVTPVLASGTGRELLGVAQPVIDPPSPDELALVTRNLSAAFEFLSYFLDLGRLRPDSQVLDIGCGVGRMAYPLAHYLSPSGRYEGFDIDPRFIEVAERRFGQLPNFHFRCVDVSNGLYNRRGALDPATFAFPYPDASLDLAILASVFTHMRPPAVQHYLNELRRVLRPGGRAVASMFLLDGESASNVAQGRSRLALRHDLGGFYAQDTAQPEGAIGYDRDVVVEWLRERGFSVEAVHPGSWCGRARFTSFQDLVAFAAP